MKGFNSSWWLLAVLALILLGVSGCSTTDPENASVRPWNSPIGWENGIPTDMYQNH